MSKSGSVGAQPAPLVLMAAPQVAALALEVAAVALGVAPQVKPAVRRAPMVATNGKARLLLLRVRASVAARKVKAAVPLSVLRALLVVAARAQGVRRT